MSNLITHRSNPLLALLTTAFLSSASLSAHEAVPSQRNFATVKLFFVNTYLPETQDNNQAKGGGRGLGGMASGAIKFETADLYLDDKLVSNIMFRHVDVMPTLNLPTGEHVFRIHCDGYRPFEKTLTVLGNGSVQWLVVQLQREPGSTASVNRDSANLEPVGESN